jgi:hypothetical protein
MIKHKLKSQSLQLTGAVFILAFVALGASGCSKSKSLFDSSEENIQQVMLEKIPIGTHKDQVLKYISERKLKTSSGPRAMPLDSTGREIGKSDVQAILGFCETKSFFCECVVWGQFVFDSNDKLIMIRILKDYACM